MAPENVIKALDALQQDAMALVDEMRADKQRRFSQVLAVEYLRVGITTLAEQIASDLVIDAKGRL